jgi:hypothetical protein
VEVAQLSLFDAQISGPVAQPEVREDVQAEVLEEREPIIWDEAHLAGAKLSGGEWATIRMRLLRWARGQGYPEVSFPMGVSSPGVQGGIVGIVQQGEVRWLEMFQAGKDEFILCLVKWIEQGKGGRP